MNLLLNLYPGDAAVEIIGRVVIEIALVISLATLLSVFAMQRRPAARYALWLGVLMTVGLSPFVLTGMERAGWTWLVRRPPGLIEMPQVFAGPASPITVDVPLEVPRASAGQNLVGDPADVTYGIEAGTHSIRQAPVVVESTPHAAADNWRSLAGAGVFVWTAGAIFLFLRLLRGDWQVRRLLADVQPVAAGQMEESLEIAAGTLGVERLPPIAISSAVAGPVVAGLIRPTVVLPAELVGHTEASQLADVLVHECSHVLRRDLWIGLAQRLVQMAFWPHPLIYIMNRNLSRAREEVCDNYVLRRGDAVGYAQTLLELAQHYRERRLPAATLAIFSPRWNLEDRVTGLLDPRRRHETRVGRGIFAVVLIALVMGGCVLSGIRFDQTGHAVGAASEREQERSADGLFDADTTRPAGATGTAEVAVAGGIDEGGEITGSDLKAALEAYAKGVRKILSYDITYRAQETNLLVEQPDAEREAARKERQVDGRKPVKPLPPVRFTTADAGKEGRASHSRQYFRNGHFRIECLGGTSGNFEVGQRVIVWNGESHTSFNGREGTAFVQSTASNHAMMGEEVPHYELFYRMAFGDYLYSKIVEDRESTCTEKDGLLEIEAPPAPTRLVNLNGWGWRLLLDPHANYLPKRITLTVNRGDETVDMTQIDNTLEEVRPGVWFPVEAIVSYFVSMPDSPQFKEKTGYWRYRLDRERCRFNVPVDGDLFDLRLPNGTVVNDRRIVVDGPSVALTPLFEEPPSKPERETGRLMFGAQLQTTLDGIQRNSTALVEVELETGRTRKHQFDGFYRTPRISPDGQTVIYAHHSWFRGFDLNRVPWYRNFAGGINGDVQALWLPNGQSIVVSSYKEARDGIQAWETFQVNLDGSERKVLPIPETELATDISRDGKWLATRSNRHPPHNNGHQIYVMRLDGTEQRRLTQDAGNRDARISPDGQRVAYIRSNGGATQLRIVNFDGTGERTILSSEGAKNAIESVAWSPGGQRLAVIRSRADDAMYSLEIVYVDDGTRLRLEPENTIFTTIMGLDWR